MFNSNSTTRLAISTVLVSVLALQLSNLAMAKNKSDKTNVDGQTVYAQYCASCHQDGGNVTVPSKAVAGSRKLSTLAVFQDYLNNPVGHMPYYKNIIEDKKTLEALYKYCKTLSKENIKQVSHAPHSINKF